MSIYLESMRLAIEAANEENTSDTITVRESWPNAKILWCMWLLSGKNGLRLQRMR